MSVAPYGQYYSPYVGMGNDPINRFDPDGGWDGDDIIDIDVNCGKILNYTVAAGNDIVRFFDNGKIIKSVNYGGNGSFMNYYHLVIDPVNITNSYSTNVKPKNLFNSYYIDPRNRQIAGFDIYFLKPTSFLDYKAMEHGLFYNKKSAKGVSGALFNLDVLSADIDLAKEAWKNSIFTPGVPQEYRNYSTAVGITFTGISISKTVGLGVKETTKIPENSKNYLNEFKNYLHNMIVR